jgi:hypothetical protein
MYRPAWPLFVLICLPMLVSLAGCGYRWTAALDGSATRTVRLETVENRLFPHRPGMEYELTRRLKDEIATDRRLELTEGQAEIRLRVSLVRFTEPTMVLDLETGDPAEIMLSAAADIDATGGSIPGGRRKRLVNVSITYTPGLGDTREDGLARLWRELSRDILDVAADTEWAN